MTFGLLLGLAFIVCLWVAVRLAAHNGLPTGRLYDLALVLLPAAFFGTKLLMICSKGFSTMGQRELATSDPAGFTGYYFGGFLSCLLVSVVALRWWKLSWFRVADVFAPGLAIGNVFGRIGCFAAGCCWGKPTSSALGVSYEFDASRLTGVPPHIPMLPTQLIEASANLGIFVLLLWLWKRRAFRGQVILAYTMLYSAERLIVEFWRADPRGHLAGLSVSQWISLWLLPLGLVVYCLLRIKGRDDIQLAELSSQPGDACRRTFC